MHRFRIYGEKPILSKHSYQQWVAYHSGAIYVRIFLFLDS